MNFHNSLEQALRSVGAEVAVAVLRGLHERGALDLDVRDEDGLTLFDRIAENAALAPAHIDFLDSIGRSDVYACAHQDKWNLMDRQLKFTIGKGLLPDAQALAMMIDKVQPEWWQRLDHPQGDEGSTVSAALAPLVHASKPLRALWARGVDVHARLGNRERLLAVQFMSRPETLDAFQSAGGDFNTPSMLTEKGHYAMWRPILKRHDSLLEKIQSMNEEGLINPDHFELDAYLKKARKARKNRTEMMKVISSRDDWCQARTFSGDPVWIELVRERPDLAEEFIGRKRKRPDFTQRDSKGRTIWHEIAVNGITKETFSLLDAEIGHQQHMLSEDGQGLLGQVLDAIMRRKRVPHGVVKAVLDLRNTIDPEFVLAGVDQVDFSVLYKRVENVEGGANPFFELLVCEDAIAKLTSQQRGYLIAGCVLGDKKMHHTHQTAWKAWLCNTQAGRSFFSQDIYWPQVKHERLEKYARERSYDASVFEGRPLIEEWVNCLQRQAINQATVEVENGAGRKIRL